MEVVYKILSLFRMSFYAVFAIIVSFFSVARGTVNKHIPKEVGYGILSQQSFYLANEELREEDDLNHLLLIDFNALSFLSKTMRRYELSMEEFTQYFEEGLEKSIAFIESSSKLDGSDIDAVIKRCFRKNLSHQTSTYQLVTTDLDTAIGSLQKFSGGWDGYWKTQHVLHQWLPVREVAKSIADEVTLLGFQSCFTGDGFGWNYVLRKEGEILILGFVYHCNTYGNLTSQNPHYAFLNTNNQLFWVSDTHIYNEFIREKSKYSKKKQYVISEVAYEKNREELIIKQGFQTTYTATSSNLPIF